MRRFIAGALLLFGTPVGAQTLSSAERKMRDWVQAHMQQEVDYLAKVVNINSGTFNLAGVKSVGDEFAKEFEALGFETRWIPMPAEMKRAGHFFAEHKANRKGRRNKTILLIGHLDTVFEGEGQKWSLVDDSTAKGAGSSDMKGGDVVILYALKAMKAAGTLDDTNIRLAMKPDFSTSFHWPPPPRLPAPVMTPSSELRCKAE